MYPNILLLSQLLLLLLLLLLFHVVCVFTFSQINNMKMGGVHNFIFFLQVQN